MRAAYALWQGRQLPGSWVKYDSELFMLNIAVHIPALGGATDLPIPAWAGDGPVLTLRRVFGGGGGDLWLSGAAKVLPCRDGLGFSLCVFRTHGHMVLINQYLPSPHYISHTSVTETKQLTETA